MAWLPWSRFPQHGLDALEIADVAYDCVECDSLVEVTISYRLGPPVALSGFSVKNVYTIDSSGSITIAVSVVCHDDDV